MIKTASDRVGLRALRMKGAMREAERRSVPVRLARLDALTARQVARAFSRNAGVGRAVTFSFVIEPTPLGQPEIRLIRTDDGSLGVLGVTGLVSKSGLADGRVRWKPVQDALVGTANKTLLAEESGNRGSRKEDETNWRKTVEGLQVQLRPEKTK